ncbi:hypothetical protein OAG71_00480 [bacterium]|nr:hypothetical protein [bacterium]
MKWNWDMFGFGDRDRSCVDPESEVLGYMMLQPNCCDSGIDCDATDIARIFTSVSFATPEHAAKHAKILLDKNR